MTQVILGGGISGLSAAYYLTKLGKFGIRIYESSDRVGGWIHSTRSKNGALFELGPRTLTCAAENSYNTLMLSAELGLISSIVPLKNTSPAAKNKKICYNSQLVSVPMSFGSLFRVKPPYIKPLMFAFWQDLTAANKPLEDDSVYNFLARRFGEDYAEYVGSSLVCGIFGGDSKEISVKYVFNDAFQCEQEYGSVIKGLLRKKRRRAKLGAEARTWNVWSYQNGLESLPEMLKNHLLRKDNRIIALRKRCSKIFFNKGKAVLTINGEEEEVDHVYSSLPSWELAKILPQHSFLKTELSSIPFVNIALVNFEYEGSLIEEQAFGFLVPPNQNLPILGVVYDSCIFPQDGKTVLSVLMGGRWFEKYFGSNPENDFLLQTAEDHIRKILKINKNPTESKVTVLKNCIPQYVVGHSSKVNRIRQYIASKNLPLTVFGNSFDGVGVHDAIMSAKTNVEKHVSQS